MAGRVRSCDTALQNNRIQPYQYNHEHEIRTKWPPLCNTIFFNAVSWLKICEFQNERPLGAKPSTCRVYSWRRCDMVTLSLKSQATRQCVQKLLRLKTIHQGTHQSTAFEIYRPLLDRRKINYSISQEICTRFVVLCFVVAVQSFIMNSHEVFIHIHQGCFAGTGAIVRLPQCQWSKPDGYGKISQCITTTKHSKAKTVCIFLGIYCMRKVSPYLGAYWGAIRLFAAIDCFTHCA